jgi:hypothetical protein
MFQYYVCVYLPSYLATNTFGRGGGEYGGPVEVERAILL